MPRSFADEYVGNRVQSLSIDHRDAVGMTQGDIGELAIIRKDNTDRLNKLRSYTLNVKIDFLDDLPSLCINDGHRSADFRRNPNLFPVVRELSLAWPLIHKNIGLNLQ